LGFYQYYIAELQKDIRVNA